MAKINYMKNYNKMNSFKDYVFNTTVCMMSYSMEILDRSKKLLEKETDLDDKDKANLQAILYYQNKVSESVLLLSRRNGYFDLGKL